MPSTTLTIRVPTKLKNRLDRLAKQSKQSRSTIAVDAVDKFVTEQERQQAVLHTAENEISAGKYIVHDHVRRWLLSWGSEKELPPPTCK